MNVQQMIWKPALLKLTHIPVDGLYGGKSTAVFIEPGTITTIRRALGRTKGTDGKEGEEIECTVVFFCHGDLLVEETPEEVTKLRDAAFGHVKGNKLNIVP